MPAPRMRPRALSMQMKIKGEILPDGASDDEDEEDEGMVVDGDESGERGKAVPAWYRVGWDQGEEKGDGVPLRKLCQGVSSSELLE